MSGITIYTDGACSGNPGPGGWAAIINFGDRESVLDGGAEHTTNNQMELLAVIHALQAVPSDKNISIFTDSKYVQLGITEWITNWKRNGWRTATKKPIKNSDLWVRLDNLSAGLKVSWQWVKGHSDNEINQRVDLLARTALERYRAFPTISQ
ncbi:MAG: ribonuclease HI [Candidatus Portiera sp.]|nr:ribonuclease HI [Portiera sp.]